MRADRTALCLFILMMLVGVASAQVNPPTCNVTNTVIVRATIVVSNTAFDGGCTRYVAGPELGDGGQGEDQKPVFKVIGGMLRNVVLGAPAADGIHTEGNVTLSNITWEDVGEDAMTIKKSGTVTIDGGRAFNADDKIFQINAASTFNVRNFIASNGGKFIRQNGGTTFTVNIFIDNCDISDMDEAIARTDSPTTTVRMTNTRYSNIGDALFIGFAPGNVSQSGNTEY
jgi:pectate lyase C